MKHSRRRFLGAMAIGLATVACRSVPGVQPTVPNSGTGTPAPENPGAAAPSPVASRDGSPTPAVCRAPRAYVQFAVNVHDWVHYDESADTLLRAADLFERHGARADFYLTGTMANTYGQHRPDVLDRLRNSTQSISYHVRPPHPLYPGFDGRLKALNDSALQQAISDYETYGLDLETGGLVREEMGGYALVAEQLGRAPVVVGVPSSDQRVRVAALDVYRSMGARMAVFFHEEGTMPETPFEWRSGMLARPSDFSITRWVAGEVGANSEKGQFWWNMMDTPHAAAFNPTAYLAARMESWENARPALLTALIHENNWSRSGPEAWTPIYWADAAKSVPNQPPYDLGTRDPSKARSASQKEAIWAAYEELVACAASEYAIASSEDILALAQASGTGGMVGSLCGSITNPG